MRKFVLLILLALTFTGSLWAQFSTGAEAGQIVPGADKVWEKPHLLIPAYVHFSPERLLPRNQFETFFQEAFQLTGSGYGLKSTRTDNDQLGHLHERFVQEYQGIPVEGSMLIVHSNQGHIYSFNGEYYALGNPATLAGISASVALNEALKYVGAQEYAWQANKTPAHEHGAHREAYTMPQGELVMVPVDGDYKAGEFRLAWKYDVYALEPLSRKDIFVDAQSGEVIFEIEKLHSADSKGTAVTRYHGTQQITTDSVNATSFRLRETGRGNGIETYNAGNGTSYGNSVDFTDSDNYWNNNNPSQRDNAATDAHWGAEMLYDYLLIKHGRNSIDGNGFRIRNYVHWGNQSTFNAFWNGTAAHYFDGNTTPMTSIDIVAHELGHGLTGNSAQLVYRNESGALNESFSDIFGKSVEKYAWSSGFSWRIANALGRPFRDMANPNVYGDPKNYLGNSWYTGSGDNGGVHINSGVQNHWYYLLVTGGSGINDFNDPYNVVSIGFDSAAAVAFRNLTVYLSPNSEYVDARFYAIQSAIDLYGNCSNVHAQVANAWHAVGIGPAFTPNPVVDFAALATSTCSFPYVVDFVNLSAGVASVVWNFGDGTTSTMINPRHTYATPGTYSITLGAVGTCGGTASVSKPGFIQIDPAPTSPMSQDVIVDCQQTAVLIAQDSNQNQILWYNANNEFLGKGDTLITPPQGSNATFYAVAANIPASVYAGRSDNIGGAGGNLSTDIRYLVFDVMAPATLNSVKVYAQGAGIRLIEYRNSTGVVLASKTAFLPDGESRVQLGFSLVPGTDFQLGLSGRADLFANNSNLNYPYDIPGLLSIKGTNDANPTQFYVSFYDWEVVTGGCQSAGTPVQVMVNAIGGPLVPDEERCGPGTLTFTATSFDSVLNWYDANGSYLASGPSFTTPRISATTTYSAENVFYSRIEKTGINGNPNNSRYLNDPFDQHLAFTVLQPMRLRSVWANADVMGIRDIILSDGTGVPMDTLAMALDSGVNRILLDLELQPGRYRLGGLNLGLTYSTSGVLFPYEIPGILSIDQSSNGLTNYYFFYDWEVQASICRSDPVTVTATVTPGPSSDFGYSQNLSSFQFTDQSNAATTWTWDFGDGNGDTQQNPSHTYVAAGTYTVSLTTSDGNCENVHAQTVVVDQVTSLEGLLDKDQLKLYPNPGRGSFTLEVALETAHDLQIRVYNLMGQEVYVSSQVFAPYLKEEVNLGASANGTYMVSLEVGGQRIFKKYVLSR